MNQQRINPDNSVCHEDSRTGNSSFSSLEDEKQRRITEAMEKHHCLKNASVQHDWTFCGRWKRRTNLELELNTGLETSSLNRPLHCSLRMLRIAKKPQNKTKPPPFIEQWILHMCLHRSVGWTPRCHLPTLAKCACKFWDHTHLWKYVYRLDVKYNMTTWMTENPHRRNTFFTVLQNSV